MFVNELPLMHASFAKLMHSIKWPLGLYWASLSITSKTWMEQVCFINVCYIFSPFICDIFILRVLVNMRQKTGQYRQQVNSGVDVSEEVRLSFNKHTFICWCNILHSPRHLQRWCVEQSTEIESRIFYISFTDVHGQNVTSTSFSEERENTNDCIWNWIYTDRCEWHLCNWSCKMSNLENTLTIFTCKVQLRQKVKLI